MPNVVLMSDRWADLSPDDYQMRNLFLLRAQLHSIRDDLEDALLRINALDVADATPAAELPAQWMKSNA